jgi:hypothetical protein
MHTLENDTISTITGRAVHPPNSAQRKANFSIEFPFCTSFLGVGRMTLLNKKTLAVLAITVAALPIFALVDPQSTVRIKATFINLLPIDAQIKTDAIKDLCQAAYVGNSSFERFDCISSLSRE